MKLNAYKTKTMIVSRSRTMHPQSPPLTVSGTVLKESVHLDILVVTFHSKITFEKHIYFALFPVQFLRGSVCLGNPGKYFTIGCSSGDAFAVLSYLLWSGVVLG